MRKSQWVSLVLVLALAASALARWLAQDMLETHTVETTVLSEKVDYWTRCGIYHIRKRIYQSASHLPFLSPFWQLDFIGLIVLEKVA